MYRALIQSLLLATLMASPALAEEEKRVGPPGYQTLDSTYSTALKHLDAFTALLVERDRARAAQRFDAFGEISAQNADFAALTKYNRSLMTERRKALALLAEGKTVSDLEGGWVNATTRVRLERIPQADKTAASRLRLTVTGFRAGHSWGEYAPTPFDFTADMAEEKDGWWRGSVNFTDSFKKPAKATLSLRRQGVTLRINLAGYEGETQASGSYFPLGDSPSGTIPLKSSPAPALPSFPCTELKLDWEREVCSDPELAALDRDLAKAWAGASGSVAGDDLAALKADQKHWHAAVDGIYDYDGLTGIGAKADTTPDRFDQGHDTLVSTFRNRVGFLVHYMADREGYLGDWQSAEQSVSVKSGDKPGTFNVIGGGGDLSDYKAACSYGGTYKLDDQSRLIPIGADGSLDTTSAPILKREGGRLLVDPDFNDETSEQPDYCSHMRSAKGVLFPVREISTAGHD